MATEFDNKIPELDLTNISSLPDLDTDELPSIESTELPEIDTLPDLPDLPDFEQEEPPRKAASIPTAPRIDNREGGIFKNIQVKEEEIAAIASKYNVSKATLRFLADMQGGERQYADEETSLDFMKSLAAATVVRGANSFLFGIPQFAYKKTQSEDMAHAIDEVVELAQRKRSYTSAGLEFLIPSVGVRKAVTAVSGKLLTKGATKLGTEAIETGAKVTQETAPLLSKTVPIVQEGVTAPMSETAARSAANVAEKVREDVFADAVTDAITAAANKRAGYIKQIKQTAAEGALTGGLTGLGYSKEDQEWESMTSGALLGAGIGATAGTVGALYQRRLDKYAMKARESRIDVMETIERRKAEGLDKDLYDKYDRFTGEGGILGTNTRQLLENDPTFGVLNRPEIMNAPIDKIGLSDAKSFFTNTAGEVEFSPKRIDRIKRLNPDMPESTIYAKALQEEALIASRRIIMALTGKKGSEIKDVVAEINKLKSSGYSAADLNQAYASMLNSELLTRAVRDAKNALPVTTGDIATVAWAEKTANFLSDASFVASGADRRYGTNILGDVLDLSKKQYEASAQNWEIRKSINEAEKVFKKANTDNDLIYRALDTGAEIPGARPEEVKALDTIRTMLAKTRALANQQGADIKEVKNYIKQMVVEPAEYMARMHTRKTEIAGWLGGLTDGRLKLFMEQAPETLSVKDRIKFDYIHALEMVVGMPVKSVGNMRRAISLTESTSAVNKSISTKVRAAIARQGYIPDFIKEKDVFKIVNSYTSNTLHEAYSKNGINKIKEYIPVFRRTGDAYHAEYFTRLLEDMSNSTDKFTELTRNAATAYKAGLLKAAYMTDNVSAKNLYENLSTLPDTINYMAGQMYHNLLGWNPKSAAKNLVTPFTQTALEIGPEGEKLMFYGLKETLKKWRTEGRDAIEKGLQQKGYLGGEFSENIATLAEAQAGKVITGNLPAQTIAAINRTGMWMFSTAEAVNRNVIWEASKKMLEDIDAGSIKKYAKFLDSMPVRIREQIVKGERKTLQGDLVADPTKALADYLIGRTMLMYTPATASRFRRLVGPMLGAFTKFPSGAIGDVTDKLRTYGVMEGTAQSILKWYGPYAALTALNAYMDIDPDDLTDRQKLYLESGKGFKAYSPHDALTGYYGLPPVVKFLKGFAEAGSDFSKLEWEDLDTETANQIISRRIARNGTMFVPGTGLMELLAKDVPTLITGETPDYSE